MATRIKPQALIINDVKQADEALAELAAIMREVGEIEAAMNAIIDGAKDAAAKKSQPMQDRRKELEAALATFGNLRKPELFKDKKSLELNFGIIGFRKSTSLRTKAKTTWAAVLERLKELGLTTGIRTKEEVDKDVLRAWPEERLEAVGVRRDERDEFYVEVKQEEVAS
jgi:phage host-nuclease inhibitor protein Gam